MFKELSEIAPASFLLALMFWAGVSYFVTAPEISARIAAVDYIPGCKIELENMAEKARSASLENYDENNRDRNQAARYAEQMNNALDGIYGGFTQKYGTNPFDALTGGMLSGGASTLSNKLRAERDQMERQAALMKEKIIASAPSQCACRARLSFIENRMDWSLFTGTFGFIKPQSVERYGENMREQARVCAERVG